MASPGANRGHPDSALGAPSDSETGLHSAAERVLGTPELLRAIHEVFQIGWVSDEDRERDALVRNAKRVDLASCARVSRRFSEHALDVLWRTLDTTLPLLRVLPPFYLIEGYTWALAREITTGEWARFQTYALRVRGLRFELPRVDPLIWTLLARHYHGRPILPNLRVISTMELTTEHVSAMVQFLSPGLCAASISFEAPLAHTSYSTPLPVVGNASGLLFKALSDIAPRLTTLHWSAPASLAMRHSGYMLDINRFERLTSFTGGDFVVGLSLVLGLSTIKSLSHLSLSIHFSDAEYATLPDGLDPLAAFQKLRTLNLGGRARDIVSMMSCMRPASLEELALNLGTVPITIATPGALLSELCQHLPQSLVSFTLSSISVTSPTADSGFELHDYINPLLSFKNLLHFGLTHEDPMLQMTDLGLSLLAEAWPKLQSMRIDLPHTAAARTARPTVCALVAFALRCPELYSLSLCGLDARSLPPDSASVPVLNHPLEHICLKLLAFDAGNDEQALRFAITLDQMFPRLVDVYISDNVQDTYQRHPGPTSSRLVQQFLKAIRSGRKHDRMLRERSASLLGLGPGPTVKDGSEPGGSSYAS